MVSGRADPPWSAEFGLEGETIDGMGLIREFSFAGQDHSRRWRQVGGPRRVSPTVLRAPRHIRQSRSYHRREQSFAHSGVRSVAPGLYRSLPFRRFPRRWNPTFLSSVQNLHLTFASVRVFRGSISSSRRWRQVGGPRRVSLTSFSLTSSIKSRSSCLREVTD
jgi:hypothetical protein